MKPIADLPKGTKLDVYSLRPRGTETIWIKVGAAFVNKDNSLNVLLDVLPLDGKLNIRAPNAKEEPSDTAGSSEAA